MKNLIFLESLHANGLSGRIHRWPKLIVNGDIRRIPAITDDYIPAFQLSLGSVEGIPRPVVMLLAIWPKRSDSQ